MALATALQQGKVELAKKLIDHGADVNELSQDSPLWFALDLFRDGKCSLEIIDLLLSKGANQKWSHEEWGCHSSSSETCWQKAVAIALTKQVGELLVLFLKYGGDPNEKIRETFGGMRTDGVRVYYPLHIAGSSASCVAALLKAGANPDHKNSVRVSNERGYNQDSSETLLFSATLSGNLEVARSLLEHGANPNLVGRWLDQEATDDGTPDADPRGGNYRPSVRCVANSSTPLCKAIERDHYPLARLLVIHGADPTITQKRSGKNAIALCKEKGGNWNQLLDLQYENADWISYPKPWKDQMFTLALCNLHGQWKLSNDVLHVIFTFIIKSNQRIHLPEPENKERRGWYWEDD